MYYRNRYYDPEMRRFISEDPVWDPQQYAYVGNNPISFSDPYGLETIVAMYKGGFSHLVAFVRSNKTNRHAYYSKNQTGFNLSIFLGQETWFSNTRLEYNEFIKADYNEIISIDSLDDDKIIDWIESHTDPSKESFSARQNCSEGVLRVINAGLPDVFVKLQTDALFFEKPWTVMSLLRRFKANPREFMKQYEIKEIKRNLTEDFYLRQAGTPIIGPTGIVYQR